MNNLINEFQFIGNQQFIENRVRSNEFEETSSRLYQDDSTRFGSSDPKATNSNVEESLRFIERNFENHLNRSDLNDEDTLKELIDSFLNGGTSLKQNLPPIIGSEKFYQQRIFNREETCHNKLETNHTQVDPEYDSGEDEDISLPGVSDDEMMAKPVDTLSPPTQASERHPEEFETKKRKTQEDGQQHDDDFLGSEKILEIKSNLSNIFLEKSKPITFGSDSDDDDMEDIFSVSKRPTKFSNEKSEMSKPETGKPDVGNHLFTKKSLFNSSDSEMEDDDLFNVNSKKQPKPFVPKHPDENQSRSTLADSKKDSLFTLTGEKPAHEKVTKVQPLTTKSNFIHKPIAFESGDSSDSGDDIFAARPAQRLTSSLSTSKAAKSPFGNMISSTIPKPENSSSDSDDIFMPKKSRTTQPQPKRSSSGSAKGVAAAVIDDHVAARPGKEPEKTAVRDPEMQSSVTSIKSKSVPSQQIQSNQSATDHFSNLLDAPSDANEALSTVTIESTSATESGEMSRKNLFKNQLEALLSKKPEPKKSPQQKVEQEVDEEERPHPASVLDTKVEKSDQLASSPGNFLKSLVLAVNESSKTPPSPLSKFPFPPTNVLSSLNKNQTISESFAFNSQHEASKLLNNEMVKSRPKTNNRRARTLSSAAPKERKLVNVGEPKEANVEEKTMVKRDQDDTLESSPINKKGPVAVFETVGSTGDEIVQKFEPKSAQTPQRESWPKAISQSFTKTAKNSTTSPPKNQKSKISLFDSSEEDSDDLFSFSRKSNSKAKESPKPLLPKPDLVVPFPVEPADSSKSLTQIETNSPPLPAPIVAANLIATQKTVQKQTIVDKKKSIFGSDSSSEEDLFSGSSVSKKILPVTAGLSNVQAPKKSFFQDNDESDDDLFSFKK